MNVFPQLDAFRSLAKPGAIVPVCQEMTADGISPVAAYNAWRGAGPAFLLESVAGGEHIGRYSFLGVEPREVISARDTTVTIQRRGGETDFRENIADPLAVVEERMGAAQAVEMPDMPPFTGGAVGFVGHEYIHAVEPTVPVAAEDTLGMPTLYFAIMDQVVAFDHARQTLRIIVNAHLDDFPSADDAHAAAIEALETIVTRLTEGPRLEPAALPADSPEKAVPPGNFTRSSFEAAVEAAKAYIRAGDIIQVVGSQRFEVPQACEPLALYRALRVVNPSPYMFLYEVPEFTIVGASPEVHVRSTNGSVEIRPIAGTRRRGHSPEEDGALEQELLKDPKERAEHLMLVDLARNDIGRVCESGSVHVHDYATIERYSHVMHIVSQVEGKLRAECTPYDLLRATFPAGTLSGAPKVRALQIISELEGQRRGVYGGALGYFGFNGNLDSCIAIRTALFKNSKIYVQSGAGLVADSVPEYEYDETVNKARGLLRAIALAEQLSPPPIPQIA
ncbi:MAG: anthranilate synthase component I [Opitutales bacterium]